MKTRAALTAVLAVLGVLVAAGVTVAAGEIVSRPIGLNGSPDDLGRSLTPSSNPVTTVTVKRTVTEKESKEGEDRGSQVSPPPAPTPSGGNDDGQSQEDDEGHDDDEEHEEDEGHDDDD
jgi:hypothetical protein